MREAIGPEPMLRIDPNEAWDLATAVDRIRRLEAVRPRLGRAADAGRRRRTASRTCAARSSAKIAADQSVFTTAQLRHVLEKEAADVIVQGSHDAGGLLRFRQQAFLCDAHGLKVNRHAFMESEISFYANAQVAATIPNLTTRQPDHAPAPGRAADPGRAAGDRGRPLPPGDAPGHGFEIDEDAVGVAHERWQRDGAYATDRIHSGGEMSFDPTGLTVYVDGEYVDGAEARVPIWDHGVLYGDGIFEGMRLFAGALFRPRDHLARLERSARSLGLELPLGERRSCST